MAPNCVVRVIAVCCLMAGIVGQESGPQYSVAGVVVSSQTGETIKRAQVIVLHFDEARRVPVTFSTFTDSAGAFRFSAVPAGNYRLSAEKPGFDADSTEGPARATGEMNLTASVEDVRLKLSPLGVITGTVVDQTGQPMRGVNMIALSQQMADGMRRAQQVRSVVTDDRGVYRMWHFRPGKYYVKAAGKSGATFLYAGETSPRYQSDEAFALTYFGGSETLDTAQAIHIEAGTEARADLSLTMKPAYKIRGSLGNFVPRRTVKFELLIGDGDVSASRVSVNGDTGTFEIQDVLAGSYTVRVTQGETSAEVPITVGHGDVNGFAVQLSPAVNILIHRQLTNPSKEPESGASVAQRFLTGFCSVFLHPPGLRAGPSYTGQPGSSSAAYRRGPDELVLSGVLPGTYAAVIRCYGGYARSVTFGTQELLANPVLTIQPGTVPPPMEIMVTRGGGTILGTLEIEGGKKDTAISILLVPQFAPSTGPQMIQAGNSVNFQFGSLAPGLYAAYAFSEMREIEYRNPAFLQTLTGGVNVEVEDNQEKTMTITRLVR
jgi:uncharacterized protein (DUF2141 family)